MVIDCCDEFGWGGCVNLFVYLTFKMSNQKAACGFLIGSSDLLCYLDNNAMAC